MVLVINYSHAYWCTPAENEFDWHTYVYIGQTNHFLLYNVTGI